MIKMKLTRELAVLFGMMVLLSCAEEVVIDPVLDASVNKLEFDEEGGDMEISITSNSDWSISNQASSWLQLSQTAGSGGSTSIQITAAPNTTGLTRSTILNIISPNGQDRRITVSQISSLYPSYNTSPLPPDASGMSSNAVELAAKMKMGWNLGNTLEAIINGVGHETFWGNPVTTKEYIDFVKASGFNAIRLPTAWNVYVSNEATAEISPAWLDRVKEVVSYCVDNDMYVLLNIHWDGGWLENNCTPEMKDSVNAKQKAFWQQIATHFRDFDEHLMFASANEPEVHNAAEMEVLHTYHQTFVDAVRATGGRNSYRVLVVQGPGTNIERSYELMNMPTDEIEGRMMAELHYYSPSQFCILFEDVSWGRMAYYWGQGNYSTIEEDRNATYGNEEEAAQSFALAKKQFVDKGIPVILGEYGAYRRHESENVPLDLEKHQKSVDDWTYYITSLAIQNGMIPFWWDTGAALDRRNYTVKDQRTIDALMEGGQ
ncbi:cellulase family glycosylhydrolase [Algoriphagus sp. NG3]|uniref:cellulase family glycosylhydrolase n=1 Tax=Algoriphagus sp. NG3 TaxID=3097546 RepID=UPI002A80402A|nr:cellulase family glycosylhydrolase [Algoriphagus sp. NG3]WPR76171.1 cellulase family glycosylhydrolase [Algoriphagus sp. NG3]